MIPAGHPARNANHTTPQDNPVSSTQWCNSSSGLPSFSPRGSSAAKPGANGSKAEGLTFTGALPSLFFTKLWRSSWTRSRSQSRNSCASCCELPRNCKAFLETMLYGERAQRLREPHPGDTAPPPHFQDPSHLTGEVGPPPDHQKPSGGIHYNPLCLLQPSSLFLSGNTGGRHETGMGENRHGFWGGP